MSPTDALLWVAMPYAVAAVFVVGHVWRYRYDQFGWTTRSSQVYENRLLRWGSPMFHLGILMVVAGHVVGLLIPRAWLEALGVDEHTYHLGATWLGTAAAVLTIAGLGILVYRRRMVGPVFLATTRSDKLMYLVLAATLGFGTAATVLHQVFGDAYDYRGSISPWVRSLLTLQPQPELMAGVPAMFQVHVVSAMVLCAIWPFTRLVHVFSAPVGYLFRPYVVYRSRDAGPGSRAARPGWEGVERPGARPRL
ncbi:respiratory nitrate reductase subunit gamma [Cellulomonas xiejunii]|uniref:Respiratory nitrate reductase subunit gamma n=1 Tax=Cellulomonas xiejunii TaxID=2968083 RepID=A0ABY5KWF0_9CELL|nr:respiratory nitrate reductase subunit gamma [Cellulomonas xiejunii]MCC2323025.1 respiratory nitrate reductase subunit gamma [Cellulomonas xiejunii]UUI73521.1 respiratory nitrate reductase subunit gamma [Cellulomonas xiejunii]